MSNGIGGGGWDSRERKFRRILNGLASERAALENLFSRTERLRSDRHEETFNKR